MKQKLFTLLFAVMATITIKAEVLHVNMSRPYAIPSENSCIIASGTCGAEGDNLTWEYSCDSVLTISGTGVMESFSYCTCPWSEYLNDFAIKSIVIEEGVTNISDYAFSCSIIFSNVDVFISSTVFSIDDNAFNFSGPAFYVDENNPYYSSIEGVLFNKDQTILIAYPHSKRDAQYTIPNTVNYIGRNAFHGCEYLKSVIIPNSVIEIEYYAFGSCDSLTSITIGSGVSSIDEAAFWGCNSLVSIINYATTPQNINPNVFGGSVELSSCTLYVPAQSLAAYQAADVWKDFGTIIAMGSEEPETPCLITSGTCGENLTWELSCDSVLTISGTGAMEEYIKTDNETYLELDTTAVPWYDYHDAITSVVIEDGVTSIGVLAFYKCTGLTSVTIGNSVTDIGSYAFIACAALKSVNIGNSVTSISYSTFAYCTALESVNIPNSVTVIGSDAFKNCRSLTSVIIPNSVTFISTYAFSRCTALTSIEIPNSVTSIGEGTFEDCISLTSINIPNSVTSIGNWAFVNCSSLTSIEIPGSVTSIGHQTFAYCTDLTSINVAEDNQQYCSVDGVLFNKDQTTLLQYPAGKTLSSYVIPNIVTSIEVSAFGLCTGLTSIEIPNSVTSIADLAFSGCSGLTSVTNYATTPQTIDADVFGNVDLPNCTLYVPAQSLAAYQAANVWKDFGNIQAISSSEPEPCISASGTCGENLTWELSCDSVLTIIGTGAMWSGEDNLGWRQFVSQIRTVILSDGLTAIAPKAFYNCTNLQSVNVPNSVRAIGHKAFVGCESLTEPVHNATIFAYMPRNFCGAYSIPEGIVSVAAYAFTGVVSETCIGVTELTIPSSVERLGISALGTPLQEITCYAVTPPTCDSTTFKWYMEDIGITLMTDKSIPVYVPAGSLAAYQAADVWKEFFNILPIEGKVEPKDSMYDVVYLDQTGMQLDAEAVTLHLPDAPEIEGFTFLKWQIVAGDLENGIHIQAVYKANESSNTPDEVSVPGNKAQKLIRNGNVYILTGNKTYTLTGQEVK